MHTLELDGSTAVGETCDDGNTVDGDGCSSTCQIENNTPVCGNGQLEDGEGCDDGNTIGGDACSATCLIETTVPGTECNSNNAGEIGNNSCESGYCDVSTNTCAIEPVAEHDIDTVDGKNGNTVFTTNNKPEIKGVCKTGSTVTAFIDGAAITPVTTCVSGEYSIIPDNAIAEGEHAVTTTDVDSNGNVLNAGPVALTINTTVPDYKPTLTAEGTIVSGAQGDFNIVVRIADFAGGLNTGAVRFSIVKNKNLSVSFDASTTEQQGSSVQNSDWTLEETSSLYIFTYKGDFAPLTSSKIGLSGTFTSPENTKGAFALDVTILGGSGETNFKNNKDTEVIQFNNLQ